MTDQIFKPVIGTYLHLSYHHVRHCLVLVEDKVTKKCIRLYFINVRGGVKPKHYKL
ncbi:hypothetical protein DICPUDRAFT_153581 [Dictyostelium purpureum]|uniref:Uncharacterized protein n=1 Tax=Dictyostelium purpureum TaxID=5786 RepID=F0ZP89_DICPU|nr:uncharacterized protein DICPUDRAFT_153581 [Dictyostelium purpureum]EGC34234.1 hypothetical protein DICPUDRAFT_153581 [Dictyostelium purpureum]|eukprot:XP_003289244.1 hypothetical protein DICPUDRAFT_153581 [Dictyostelium purpureum]